MASGRISNNTASENGGGIWCGTAGWTGTAANALITGGTISGNTATNGGGVFVCEDKLISIWGGNINKNEATNGGGIYVDIWGQLYLSHESATPSHPTISSNYASNDGGGIYRCDYGKFFAWNGTEIISNTADNNGGGIYEAFGAEGTFAVIGEREDVTCNWRMKNVKINNNSAAHGGGIYNADGLYQDIDTIEMLNNTATYTYSSTMYAGTALYIRLRGECKIDGAIYFYNVENYLSGVGTGRVGFSLDKFSNNFKIKVSQANYQKYAGEYFYCLLGENCTKFFEPYWSGLEEFVVNGNLARLVQYV